MKVGSARTGSDARRWQYLLILYIHWRPSGCAENKPLLENLSSRFPTSPLLGLEVILVLQWYTLLTCERENDRQILAIVCVGGYRCIQSIYV